MYWECDRCGTLGGSKEYPTAAEAHHYAAAFDREDRDDLGRRAPFLGMFPLRMWHRLKGRSKD